MAVDSVARSLAISAISSGGGEPDAYLKSASVSNNTLTLTNKDNSTVVYEPVQEKEVLYLPWAYTDEFTAEDKAILEEAYANPDKYVFMMDVHIAAGETHDDKFAPVEVNKVQTTLGFNYIDSVQRAVRLNYVYFDNQGNLTSTKYTEYAVVLQDKLTAGSNITIDSITDTISATDTTYTAGSNISISDSNVISATDTTYSDATTSASGLMSASDKTKLDGISTGAKSVSVSDTGTATDEVGYITIDGVEKKLAGGGGGSYTFTNGLTESGGTVSWDLNDRIKSSSYQGIFIPSNSEQTGKIKAHGGSLCIGKSNKSVLSDVTGLVAINESLSVGKIDAQSSGGIDYAPAILASNGSISHGNCTGTNSRITSDSGSFAGGSNSGGASGQVFISASGEGSFVHGCADGTVGSLSAIRKASAAFGEGSYANGEAQFVIGKCNRFDSTKALIIGNGTSKNARSNALTVDWSGNLVCNNIPAAPTDDGNYVLKCSIVDGVATYSWVQES